MPFPRGYSFRMSVPRELDAICFFSRFMTCDHILLPECSVFPSEDSNMDLFYEDESKLSDMDGLHCITLTKEDVVSERKFRVKLIDYRPDAIYCIGSFGDTDTKRVSAGYMSRSYAVEVNFASNWRPSEEQVAVVRSLFADF